MAEVNDHDTVTVKSLSGQNSDGAICALGVQNHNKTDKLLAEAEALLASYEAELTEVLREEKETEIAAAAAREAAIREAAIHKAALEQQAAAYRAVSGSSMVLPRSSTARTTAGPSSSITGGSASGLHEAVAGTSAQMDDSVVIVGEIPPTILIADIDDDEVIFVNETQATGPSRAARAPSDVIDLSESIAIEHTTPPKRRRTNNNHGQPNDAHGVNSSSQSFEPQPRIVDKTCPICLEVLFITPTYSTSCGHMFCKGCIEQAVTRNKKCPMCNNKLTRKQIHPLY